MSHPIPGQPNPQPNPTQQPQPDPKPDPTPQRNPPEDATKPPWGEDFNPEKAWNTIQTQRANEKTLKDKLAQATADQAELETLRNEKLTADQLVMKEAVDKAKAEARSEAEAEWRPRAQELQLRTIAGDVIKDNDQLEAFLELIDPAKFAGENGDIDKDKVMGHLTALFAAGQQQQAPQWGQYSGPGQQPPQQPGDAGRAEAARRQERRKQTQK